MTSPDGSPVLRRSEIQCDDIVGVVFEPDGGSESRVVVLGGSGGGVPEPLARRLAELGMTAFALGYFGGPGLPTKLVEIPLEMLERGVELFRNRYAAGQRVELLGISKGAELALLLASQHSGAIGRTVAIVPSCVIWYGLDMNNPTSMKQSSWTRHGVPLPFLSFPVGRTPSFSEDGLRVDDCYDLGGYPSEQINAARIPVEQARGPILLLSGGDDHMWPSAPMASQVERRMQEHGRSEDVTNVVYPDAGHAFLIREFLPPPGSPGSPPFDFGGRPQSDAAAAKDAWARIAAFLRQPAHPDERP
jgi:dienelactone hydrolase